MLVWIVFLFLPVHLLYICAFRIMLLWIKNSRNLIFCISFPQFCFLPIVVLTILKSTKTNLELIKETNIPAENDTDNLLYLIWLKIGIYWTLVFLKIIKHQKDIKVFASNTTKIDLNWLKYFLIGIAFMVLLWELEALNESNGFIILISVSGYFVGTYILGLF